jgi:MEDS: MEthanogen/methylotroph, DcmR Sensory domain
MCQHLALFYADAYPAEEVADFFAAGLAAGDSCLALLGAPNRRAVEQALQARGVDLPRSGYVAVDSDDFLTQLQVEGGLDLEHAHALLTPLMTAPRRGGQNRVRAVGDLAPVLCAAGHIDDALALEALVHRVTVEQNASVICAYPIQICGRGTMRSMLSVCAEHDALEFPAQPWVTRLAPFTLQIDSAG